MQLKSLLQLLLLPLLISAALAATHVNISIAQHPADVTYVDGEAPAELKAGPGDKANGGRFAKLRTAQEDGNINSDSNSQSNQQLNEQSVAQDANQSPIVVFEDDGQHAEVQHVGSNGHLQPKLQQQEQQQQQQPQQQQQQQQHQQQQHQQQRDYQSRRYQQNRQGQFRQASAQDRQNQEFERYIQNYHSGPTVETVFESASPSRSARYQYSASSSSSAGPQRLVSIEGKSTPAHTFERQVALPAAATPYLPSAEDNQQRQNDAQISIGVNVAALPSLPTPSSSPPPPQPPSPPLSSSSSSSSSASSPSLPSSSSGTATTTNVIGGGNGVNSYDGNKPVPTGGVGFGRPSYGPNNRNSRPNFDPINFNYEYNSGPRTGFNNEYPPSPEDSSDGYGGYYGGEQDFSPNAGYLPTQSVYQRPLVTKTIQIAQPALKAKKFEVRHPAIQKEFYDIEERVVIKPAGTIVVELEHPVAKIPRGETVLPLGHPHPAIAGEYNLNGQSAIQTESSSAGTYQGASRSKPNTIFSSRKGPASVISGTTIASAVTSTPTNDHNAQSDFVEANLKKQYSGEPSSDSSFREQQQRDQDLFIPADSQGNQRQIPNRNLSPNSFTREENNYNRPAHVELKHNGTPQRASVSNREQNSFNYNAPQFQRNYKNDDDEYKGEYVTGNFYNNPQDPKPARLQEQPSNANVAEPQTHIIKHEHNIHLPPSQHNIYLTTSRLEQRPAFVQQQQRPREEETKARVQEVKPYSQQQQGPVVVYASTTVRPAQHVAPQQYTQNEGRRQYGQQRNTYAQLRSYPDSENSGVRLEYSAAYSNMRYDPQESARLTSFEANNQNIGNHNEIKPGGERTITVSYNRPPETKARLTAQEDVKDVDAEKPTEHKAEVKSVVRPQTHIQIEVPQGPKESHMPIMIMSTINPPMDQPLVAQNKHQSYTAYADEVERFAPYNSYQRGDQQYGRQRAGKLEPQPDCDENGNKVSARYEYSPRTYDDQRTSYNRDQEQSSRLVETPNSANDDVKNDAPNANNIPAENIDVNVRSTSGHVPAQGSRVIAATAAPSDASAASESFHKRRIVVNHPFQTVREVVEHEPITNYHQIQVNEPASPTLYNNAAYFAPNGALRQFETGSLRVPVVYHHATAGATHGNLMYAQPDAIPVHENTDELEAGYQPRQRQRQRA